MKTFLNVFCLLLSFKIGFSQEKSHKLDSIYSLLHSKGYFNGNVLIAEKGKIIFTKSFGLRNRSTGEPLTENSIFELSSLTKQFTAFGIILLKKQGKLTLDNDITEYLPELQNYKGISVRNLLNHTSGLPDYLSFIDSTKWGIQISSNKDILNALVKFKPKLTFVPNSSFQYSNSGYVLLATIIERLSGKSYADFLKENIFIPLKMRNTGFRPLSNANFALGYLYSDSLNRFITSDSATENQSVLKLYNVYGDTRLCSTIGDLFKWDRALYSEKLIGKESIEEIFSPAILTNKEKSSYGFGWGIEDGEEGKIVSHNGGWPGYLSYIERDLSTENTIIVLQNLDREKALLGVRSVRAVLHNRQIPVWTPKPELRLNDSLLNSFVGKYIFNDGSNMIIYKIGKQLKSKVTGQSVVNIYAESEYVFYLKSTQAQVKFEKGINGQIEKAIIIQGGENHIAYKQ